ncbi:hypothetical protein XAB3213_4660003 [Xanthomonas citri pv. bilvae]|nr:hypothetical protein XAB3213_4660003 [Xanthomonas citri pv. bilvae]
MPPPCRSPFMRSTPRTTTTALPETVGARLLTERKRLGLTQTEMAERCSVTRWAQLNFEKDTNLPGGGYLRVHPRFHGHLQEGRSKPMRSVHVKAQEVHCRVQAWRG